MTAIARAQRRATPAALAGSTLIACGSTRTARSRLAPAAGADPGPAAARFGPRARQRRRRARASRVAGLVRRGRAGRAGIVIARHEDLARGLAEVRAIRHLRHAPAGRISCWPWRRMPARLPSPGRSAPRPPRSSLPGRTDPRYGSLPGLISAPSRRMTAAGRRRRPWRAVAGRGWRRDRAPDRGRAVHRAAGDRG